MKRIVAMLVLVLAVGFVAAGEIPVSWTPATDPRVAVHRVFHGAGTVTGTSASFDVPVPTASAIVTGLADCVEHHVAIKACTGTVCSAFSPVIKGWPAIRIDDVTYDAGGVVNVTGANFGPMNVVVSIDGIDKTPTNTTCTAVAVAATPGAVVKVRATQADGTVIARTFTVPLAPPTGFARTDLDVSPVP